MSTEPSQESGDRSGDETGTRLNALDDVPPGENPFPPPPDQRGDASDLAVPAELTRVGEDAAALARVADAPSTVTETTNLLKDTLVSGDFATGYALGHTLIQFTRQATTLGNRCESVAEHLDVTVTAHAGNEAEIAAEIRQQNAHHAGGNPDILALAGVDDTQPPPAPPGPTRIWGLT